MFRYIPICFKNIFVFFELLHGFWNFGDWIMALLWVLQNKAFSDIKMSNYIPGFWNKHVEKQYHKNHSLLHISLESCSSFLWESSQVRRSPMKIIARTWTGQQCTKNVWCYTTYIRLLSSYLDHDNMAKIVVAKRHFFTQSSIQNAQNMNIYQEFLQIADLFTFEK